LFQALTDGEGKLHQFIGGNEFGWAEPHNDPITELTIPEGVTVYPAGGLPKKV
jgi:hypothetical protein